MKLFLWNIFGENIFFILDEPKIAPSTFYTDANQNISDPPHSDADPVQKITESRSWILNPKIFG